MERGAEDRKHRPGKRHRGEEEETAADSGVSLGERERERERERWSDRDIERDGEVDE